MLSSRRVLIATLVATFTAAAATAEPIADSRGRWAGPIGERTGGWAATGRIELRVEGAAERFNLDLSGPGGALIAGEFRAGERKDVFGPPAPKGLASLIGRGGPANPLEGKPLAWARREERELIVYRLDLRDGAYRLDRAVLTPSGARMNVAFERREHGRPPERFTATLERGTP